MRVLFAERAIKDVSSPQIRGRWFQDKFEDGDWASLLTSNMETASRAKASSRRFRRQDIDNLESRATCAEAIVLGEFSATHQAFEGAPVAFGTAIFQFIKSGRPSAGGLSGMTTENLRFILAMFFRAAQDFVCTQTSSCCPGDIVRRLVWWPGVVHNRLHQQCMKLLHSTSSNNSACNRVLH